MNQQQVQITLPDDAAKVRYEATVPGKSTGAQPEAAIPSPTDPQSSVVPEQRRAAGFLGRLYGMPLAWRGLGKNLDARFTVPFRTSTSIGCRQACT